MTKPFTLRLFTSAGRIADAVLALLVVVIVAMMIVPLPTWLLDLLIAGNLALSILLLVTAMYAPHGLSFTSLPSVLLITTLYRLALNVSSTRLILLQADAGRVIRAFGDFVVRGDYVVGAVIFLIISLIQYLVVAKGGERVAEVAARFTLDAMPGKQLAIDADLRAGALRVDAARERRALLERESRFYGAMDGAMKFIKGDAVASLVITCIALVGGTGIGLWGHGMSVPATLKLYGLLAIGDGLVSQLPSLVTSIAAGLMVTRVAGEQQHSSLGQDLAAQLFDRPRTLVAASACLFALAIVPGLPAGPFLLLGVLGSGLAFALSRAQRSRLDKSGGLPANLTPVLAVELGSELAAALGVGSQSALTLVLERAADSCERQWGVPRPSFRVDAAADLAEMEYVVRLREAPVLRGIARTAAELGALIEAQLPGHLQRRTRELLALEDVQRWLDALGEHAPTLVQNVVPRPLTLLQLTEILRRLLDEGVSIKAFERIVESLAASSERELGIDRGLDRARRALRDQISERHQRAGVLSVHQVDALIEDAIRDAQQTIAGERVVALAPELGRDIVAAVQKARVKYAHAPILLTQADIRRGLRDILAEDLPEVAVLSFGELPAALQVEQREPIAV
jgi:type III secretion protein V